MRRLLACSFIVALVIMAGATPAPAAPPSTANLYVVDTGGTASPTRMTTPTTFASAPSSAKCSNMAVCFAAASNGDVIVIRDGDYPNQSIASGTKSTSNPVKFYGNGHASKMATLTLGNTSGSGVTGILIDGVESTNGLGVFNGGSTQVQNSTFYRDTYLEGTTDLTLGPNDVFDGQRQTPDVIDVYEQSRAPNKTTNLKIINSVIQGGGDPSDSVTHPDGIQFCNCDSAAGDVAKHAVNTVISGVVFKDNWCTNLRTNEEQDMLFENNVVFDSVADPFSACGFSASFERMKSLTARNNTFVGGQTIQMCPRAGGASNCSGAIPTMNWYNNAGIGFSAGCTGGQAAGGARANNAWTGQACGGTNLNPVSLNINTTTGVPNTGSPLIDAGNNGFASAVDITGILRPVGAAADIGAFEVGSGGTVSNSGTDSGTLGDVAGLAILAALALAGVSIKRISSG